MFILITILVIGNFNNGIVIRPIVIEQHLKARKMKEFSVGFSRPFNCFRVLFICWHLEACA
jgi:hypothetical protein